MDQEFIKLLFSQGIVATLLFFALKWLNKDRDRLLGSVSQEQKERILLLETTSQNRTAELSALHSEFAAYRLAMQSEVSAIHARYAEQITALTANYTKQVDGLQTEIRGLYKVMLTSKLCPIDVTTGVVDSPIIKPGS